MIHAVSVPRPEVNEHAQGATLKVRVSPGAAKPRILGPHAGMLKIAVSAPPEKGRANRAVRELLASALGLAPRDVELLSGEASREKTILCRGLSRRDLQDRLDRIR